MKKQKETLLFFFFHFKQTTAFVPYVLQKKSKIIYICDKSKPLREIMWCTYVEAYGINFVTQENERLLTEIVRLSFFVVEIF